MEYKKGIILNMKTETIKKRTIKPVTSLKIVDRILKIK